MIKTGYLPLFCSVLLLLGCKPVGKSNKTADVPVAPVKEEAVPSTGKTLTGFNAEYMIDVCLDGSFANGKFRNVGLHSDCAGVVEALDPEVLRWPGGITAQYYHFNGTGYGYRSDEVRGTEYEGNAEKVQELLEINYIEVFMEMARGRKVIFVANLLHGTVVENLQAIRYLREGGAEVIGVELGNEFYFSKMTPEEYLDRTKPYIDAITDIKLAVHMAPDFGAKNQHWNRTVAAADVDAVVIHEYNRMIKNSCKQSGRREFFDCALEKADQFTGNYIGNLLDGYRRKYGNKEIWLTEWNLAPRTRDVYGTFVQSYNNFRMLNQLNELDVEIALFHNLITGGSMYPVATRKKEQLTINPDFYVHQMMPKGDYLGSGRIGPCQVWYYSDGVAIANATGTHHSIAVDAFERGGRFSDYELLVSDAPWSRPVYSSGKVSGILIPAYGLVVLR